MTCLFALVCDLQGSASPPQLHISPELHKIGRVGHWPRDQGRQRRPDDTPEYPPLPGPRSGLPGRLVRTDKHISRSFILYLRLGFSSKRRVLLCSYLYPDGRDGNPDMTSLYQAARQDKVKVTEASGCSSCPFINESNCHRHS